MSYYLKTKRENRENILWNVCNRIEEFYEVIDDYLKKLEFNNIISKGERKAFLKRSFEGLYEDIMVIGIINIEDLDYERDYKKIIVKKKKELKELEKEVEEKQLKNIFTPLIVFHVGNKKKCSCKKRHKHKKSGRPRLIDK